MQLKDKVIYYRKVIGKKELTDSHKSFKILAIPERDFIAQLTLPNYLTQSSQIKGRVINCKGVAGADKLEVVAL